MGGSFDRAPPGITDAIGYLRAGPEPDGTKYLHCRRLSRSAMAMG